MNVVITTIKVHPESLLAQDPSDGAWHENHIACLKAGAMLEWTYPGEPFESWSIIYLNMGSTGVKPESTVYTQDLKQPGYLRVRQLDLFSQFS